MGAIGHDAATAAFRAALNGDTLHHAWLLAGPPGIGKATLARSLALELLAFGSMADLAEARARASALMKAGSHPDYRELARLARDAAKPELGLARSITIAQVRALQPLFATMPSLGSRRAIVIDAIDDLERAGANALLKSLEEPPAGTVFLLVSHAPGRLLPTIRSRCRLLRLDRLSDDDVGEVLARELPDAGREEIDALVRTGGGAPGVALRHAGLQVEALDAAITAIMHDGDRDNHRRVALGKALAGKGAAERFDVFLDRVTAALAAAAAERRDAELATALDAYAEALSLAEASRALSLDPQTTVFDMGRILARLAR